ncbi:MAG: hypothetical protein BGO25_12635 [Acidobacteriales bacterium 59-55]|nr:MAG: hypothetical protein BGO25_12635 [Acidobacteriales bacterium 59-55]
MPPLNLAKYFVVGISSSALFDLRAEDEIFRTQGLKAYSEYQIAHEQSVLMPGTGFPLVQAILSLNGVDATKKRVIVLVMSKNNADTSLRVSNSIRHHEIDVGRGAYTSGACLAPYLKAFSVDLFLSASQEDVQDATNAGFAAGLIYPYQCVPGEMEEGLRIAFDGDAVLFSGDSEKVYQEKGLTAFLQHEEDHAHEPLADGPFAKLFRTLAALQRQGDQGEKALIRTALVTARNSPADERVIRTLRAWRVRVDEVFFMGGAEKAPVLEAFRPHIFFDDQDVHCLPASGVVLTARVFSPAQPAKQTTFSFEIAQTSSATSETVVAPNEKKSVGGIPAIIIPIREDTQLKSS